MDAKQRARGLWGLGIIFAIAIVVVGGIYVIARTGSSNSANAGSGNLSHVDCQTTACNLATVDEGGYVSPDDPIVSDYQVALNGVHASCNNTDSRIADMAFTAKRLLAQAGIDKTLLTILQELPNTSPLPAPIPPGGGDCTVLASDYVVQNGG